MGNCLFPQVCYALHARYTVPDYERGVAKWEGDAVLGEQDGCNLIGGFSTPFQIDSPTRELEISF